MASITSLVLLFLISLASKTLEAQTPTIADCTPRLLPLTPCAPFVQGISQSPPPSCCANLQQLSLQQPGCVCLLLNDTNLSSFPINSTLALQLPALCQIQLTSSSCSGLLDQPQVPTISPASQVSLGAHSNSSNGRHTNSSNGNHTKSSVAASPVIQVAPRPIIPLGFPRNAAIKLKAEGLFVLLGTVSAILLAKAID